MRLLHPRFTVRRLMLAVAIFGMILWATITIGKVRRWRETCLMEAHIHQHIQIYLRMNKSTHSPSYGFDPYLSAKDARRAEHHARMAKKWDLAADHPWSSVEPDPPEPD